MLFYTNTNSCVRAICISCNSSLFLSVECEIISCQTSNHNWAILMGSCATQTYNPYGVAVGDTVEQAVCDETEGSYYHLR